ncbi:MAG: hypothetical protein JO353_03220 [Phycisphaerae bacterium]|nr:hypothetical protein [Phycisphaerae bacterium]
MAKALDAYKHAVLAADNDYRAKLSKFSIAPQVKAIPGGQDAVQAEQVRMSDEISHLSDPHYILSLVRAGESGASTSLHKGMTKDQLFTVFTNKPDHDTTDSNGIETIIWEKKVATGGGFDPDGGGLYSTGSRTTERTTVVLHDGIVTEFSTEKN